MTKSTRAIDPYAISTSEPTAANTAQASSTPTAVAAYDHHEHGICPVCKTQMGRSRLHNNEEVYWCPTHRVCMPLPLSA